MDERWLQELKSKHLNHFFSRRHQVKKLKFWLKIYLSNEPKSTTVIITPAQIHSCLAYLIIVLERQNQ